MPSFLLDTNFCIHFMRGRAWARSALEKVKVSDVSIAAITVGELHEGAHRSDHPAREDAKVEAFLRPFEIIPLDREEAIEWGLLEARLRKEGNPIEAEDCMIAAIAHKHGLTLVSGNIKHFARVKGLRVVDWEQHPPKG
jgi:predicted nucleic acid-binding protein